MNTNDIPTPRTDAVDKILQGRPVLDVIPVVLDFARQLERELAAKEWAEESLQRVCLMLLERLAERTRDYTTNAAKELDKLRAAERDAAALNKALGRAGKFCEDLHHNKSEYHENDKPCPVEGLINKAIDEHEARIKSLS